MDFFSGCKAAPTECHHAPHTNTTALQMIKAAQQQRINLHTRCETINNKVQRRELAHLLRWVRPELLEGDVEEPTPLRRANKLGQILGTLAYVSLDGARQHYHLFVCVCVFRYASVGVSERVCAVCECLCECECVCVCVCVCVTRELQMPTINGDSQLEFSSPKSSSKSC